MRKHFLLWALSDLLTKIGCSIYGGMLVSYFFNLSLGNQVAILTYLGFFLLATFSMAIGYLGIRHVEMLDLKNYEKKI